MINLHSLCMVFVCYTMYIHDWPREKNNIIITKFCNFDSVPLGYSPFIALQARPLPAFQCCTLHHATLKAALEICQLFSCSVECFDCSTFSL